MKLKKLILINFKGIKHLEIDFKDITTIQGANRTGKSTIFDAFLWLLFGKNAEGKQDFNVKTLDENNKTIPKQEVNVFAEIDVKEKGSIDRMLVINRTLKEKWVKKRGESEQVFAGNETVYEWNDTPIQQKEFQKRIDSLINEDFFKLLTNPLYFNSLGTEKKRGMLNNIIPKISIDSKFNKFSDFEFNDLRKAISSQIKKLRKELDELPVRIDEVHKGKPEPLKFKNIQAELNSKTRSLEAVDANIINKNKVLIDFNDSKIKDQLKLNDLRVQLETYKSDFKLKNNIERTEIERKIQENQAEAAKSTDKIKTIEAEIESLNVQLEFNKTLKVKKLEEWHEKNELLFKEDSCASCGQKFPPTEIREQNKIFLENKNIVLDRISRQGQKLVFKMGELTQNIMNNQLNLGTEKDNLAEIQDLGFMMNDDLTQIKEPNILLDKKFLSLEANYACDKSDLESKDPPTIDDKELRTKKQLLILAIDDLKKMMEVKTTILTAENRIKDLETQTQTKVDILQGLENKEFEMDEFNRAKMSALETEINKKFSFVKFKMFEAQINGGEKEVCTTLINGVPFADANSESRLNAGLDIINVFSEHYDISAPIFIDNREGVTDIIPVNAQIINLVVNPEFKTLKIS